VLGSPVGACVAATDPDVTRGFLRDLGALLDEPRGFVDVVPAEGGWSRAPLEGGTAALDFYVRSVGARPHVTVALGPLVMHQARVTGPDGLPVVLIEASSRRPSLLDHDAAAEASEAHSLVWVVPSVEASAAFFTAAGLVQAFDVPIDSPAVCELMDLPDGTVVRMAMLGGEGLPPMRFELFEAPGARAWDGEVVAGMAWPVFQPTGLEAALALPWLRREQVSERAHRCVAPGGVLVELRG
jgi:hypothetical protein